MTAAVPASVFANSNVLLRVWFNDGVNGFQQLTPDQHLGSVGYAMMAASVSPGSIPLQGLPIGCSIYRPSTGATLLYSNNITAWANAVQNGDNAFVIGGSYSYTNFVFPWRGLSGIVVRAVSPQIQSIFTTGSNNLPYTGGIGELMALDNATNCWILGDWNVRVIFTSTYPTHLNAQLLAASLASYNVWFEGMHAQIEVQTLPLPSQDKALVFVSGASHIYVNNCRFGYIADYPGGETNNTAACSVSVFHGNASPGTIYFNNDIFYGYQWSGFGTNNIVPAAYVYNCWGIDENAYGVFPANDAYTTVLGTFDTNENLTYFLPGTPLPQIPINTNSLKRTPPDWGNLSASAINFGSGSAPTNLTLVGTNLVITIGGTPYYLNTRTTP
jgi:hypothetical protein